MNSLLTHWLRRRWWCAVCAMMWCNDGVRRTFKWFLRSSNCVHLLCEAVKRWSRRRAKQTREKPIYLTLGAATEHMTDESHEQMSYARNEFETSVRRIFELFTLAAMWLPACVHHRQLLVSLLRSLLFDSKFSPCPVLRCQFQAKQSWFLRFLICGKYTDQKKINANCRLAGFVVFDEYKCPEFSTFEFRTHGIVGMARTLLSCLNNAACVCMSMRIPWSDVRHSCFNSASPDVLHFASENENTKQKIVESTWYKYRKFYWIAFDWLVISLLCSWFLVATEPKISVFWFYWLKKRFEPKRK